MIKIKLDKRNTNLHTDEGLQLLDKSIDKVGIIESYTISNDGVVISGNARHEKISAKITKEPIVIETDGTEAIIIKRTDIESNTKKFHEASILANTTAHKNYNPDNDLIEEIAIEYDIDVEEVGVEEVIKKIENSEEGDLIEIPKSLQIIPKKEYLIIMADEDSEEWEELKQIFSCGLVRQGGCKIGSSSDKVGTGLERVFDLKTFKERVSNGLRISNT